MTIRHFTIFVMVCDTMNMTQAAERLYLSQPAVSQAIGELEQHYQVRLFERFGRKIYLTQPGEKLLNYARHIIKMNENVESEMKTLHESGSIRIGASVTVGAYVLPALVTDFKQGSPSTAIQVEERNTSKIETLLLKDEIDLGFVEGDIESKELITQCFWEDELFLICAPKHRFAQMSIIDPQDLAQEEFILREQGSGTRKTFEDQMREHHISWNCTWTCSNAETIKAAVIHGLGISAISKLAVQSELAAGSLCIKPIKGIRFLRQFKIVYHKNKYLTDTMKQLKELCKTDMKMQVPISMVR